jgi:hypothetical protein
MSQTLENLGPYQYYQYPAMVGMKADSMFDNVDSFACGATSIPFGVVVSSNPANGIIIRPGGTVPNVRGISLHDHLVGSRGHYWEYDAVSTLTRGRVWAKIKAGEAITNMRDGLAVFYDTATGEITATGTRLPNAVFRSNAIALPDAAQVVWATGAMQYSAIVELHHPNPPTA